MRTFRKVYREQLIQLEAVGEEMIEKKVRFKAFPKNRS